MSLTLTCPPEIGGCISNSLDAGHCAYCAAPISTAMTTVPANCPAVRHTARCACVSARARLTVLIGVLSASRRPWWRA